MFLNRVALALLIGGNQAAPGAEEALRRSLERKPSVNVDAILEQASPTGAGYVRLRMWRDTSGRRRTEILAPVALQGQISVDDGAVWTTYFPEHKRLRSHPSPLQEADDLDFRMRLLRRNYRLEIDEKTTVAGRSALRVVAYPRAADLETRRFYLDAATFIPLKTETLNELGGVTVQVAVKKIQYPARLDKSMFDALAIPGVKRDLPKPPFPLQGVDDAERRVGFRPASPGKLPMGFRAQGMDMVTWRDITPVQIRVTDGLVRLYVYQFRAPSNRPEPPPRVGDDRTSRKVGDLRVMVRGDAPLAVRERILDVYAKRLEAGLSP